MISGFLDEWSTCYLMLRIIYVLDTYEKLALKFRISR